MTRLGHGKRDRVCVRRYRQSLAGIGRRDSHTQSLGRTQAVALSVSANLLEGARSLLIVGVLVRLYIRDFYLELLGLFGVRDEDED